MAYLDKTGLTHFWNKTKTHCDTRQTDRYDPDNAVVVDDVILITKSLLSENDLATSIWTYTLDGQTYSFTPENMYIWTKNDDYVFGMIDVPFVPYVEQVGSSKTTSFYIVYAPGVHDRRDFPEAGLYLKGRFISGAYATDIVNNVIDISWGKLEKLDDKYLSDNVVLLDGSGKVPESEIPSIDWDTLKNKPFGETGYKFSKEETYTGDSIAIEALGGASYKVGDPIDTDTVLGMTLEYVVGETKNSLVVDDSIIVVSDDTCYALVYDGVPLVFITTQATTENITGANVYFPDEGVWFTGTLDESLYTTYLGSYEIKQIDEKYIPTNISQTTITPLLGFTQLNGEYVIFDYFKKIISNGWSDAAVKNLPDSFIVPFALITNYNFADENIVAKIVTEFDDEGNVVSGISVDLGVNSLEFSSNMDYVYTLLVTRSGLTDTYTARFQVRPIDAITDNSSDVKALPTAYAVKEYVKEVTGGQKGVVSDTVPTVDDRSIITYVI